MICEARVPCFSDPARVICAPDFTVCETKFEGEHWDRLSETLTTHKPDEKTLALAGLVCAVFSKYAKFSIWHIVSTDAEVLSLLEETEHNINTSAANFL